MKRWNRLKPALRTSEEAGFTLVELLVVLLIIGLLTVISIPALKGIGQSNTMTSATRQMLDDLALARHRAITSRTTVHVIFVPPQNLMDGMGLNINDPVVKRLRFGAYTTYALYAERTAGDQPGQWTGRYLTKWRSLPEGVFMSEWKFTKLPPLAWVKTPDWDRPFEYAGQTKGVPNLPFPDALARPQQVPHVAFDRNGSLVEYDRGDSTQNRIFMDEYIWLTKGSIFGGYDSAGNEIPMDVRETPPGNWSTNYNRIHVDAVTGRAKLERPEIQ
jgi:prepilin-type N-terminal cleavage/methylation domain-containing protein